jgi:hypothetical protein
MKRAVRKGGCIGGDLHLTRPFAIPLLNEHPGPWRPLIRQHRLQRRPPLPFEPGTACGPGLTWGRGIVESRVKTQPCHYTGTGQGRDLVQQLQSRKTAVCDKDDHTARQPPHHELDHLPRPCRQGLMAASALLIEALRRTQHRQKGQRPDAVGPGERSQHHTRKPTQATDFDKVRM